MRVVVIATGFERAQASGRPSFSRPQRSSRDEGGERRPEPHDRDPFMDDSQRSSLEVPDDEIDIPEFLKDK